MKIHVFAFLIAGAFAAAAGAQSIDLIQDGASRYVIYHEATAPSPSLRLLPNCRTICIA